jgi:hypothetical protein
MRRTSTPSHRNNMRTLHNQRASSSEQVVKDKLPGSARTISLLKAGDATPTSLIPSSTPLSLAASLPERCRYWPQCSNPSCAYHHPSERCTFFPQVELIQICMVISEPLVKFVCCSRGACFLCVCVCLSVCVCVVCGCEFLQCLYGDDCLNLHPVRFALALIPISVFQLTSSSSSVTGVSLRSPVQNAAVCVCAPQVKDAGREPLLDPALLAPHTALLFPLHFAGSGCPIEKKCRVICDPNAHDDWWSEGTDSHPCATGRRFFRGGPFSVAKWPKFPGRQTADPAVFRYRA